jgi:hypothetical protein
LGCHLWVQYQSYVQLVVARVVTGLVGRKDGHILVTLKKWTMGTSNVRRLLPRGPYVNHPEEPLYWSCDLSEVEPQHTYL